MNSRGSVIFPPLVLGIGATKRVLFRTTEISAAVCIVAIFVVVLLQVGLNMIDEFAGWLTGDPVGLVIPSYAEIAGFFLAAASFLALATTLRAGEHIRVTLFLQQLSSARRFWFELWCVIAAMALMGFFAYFAILLVMESFAYGDLSPGMVPIPLWLPQLAMAVGTGALTIALLEKLASMLTDRGERTLSSPRAELGRRKSR